MRLVIDCFKLIKGTGKSIGIYNVAQGIVKHLGAMNIAGEDEILVLGNNMNREDFETPGVRFMCINDYDPTQKLHLLMWELFHVSKVCKKLKADRVLFPRGFSALTHPVYDIVLIHDLIPFYYNKNFPKQFSRIENAYIMSRLKQSARGAKKIITISQSSRQDIIKYCKVKEDKIEVINNACENLSFVSDQNMNQKPYICAMTSALPHKNAIGVVKSYIKYCEMADDPYDLRIIGLESISEYTVPNDVKDRITCVKYVKSNEDLYRIIGNSEFFLFLSLYEGFGLPPLEAMLLQVPVICANTTSLPEVVGDAAVMVDPNDYEEVAEALKNLTGDKDKRDLLIEKGLKNALRFSWDKQAQQYWKTLMNKK